MTTYGVEYDGFVGTLQGGYVTREGRVGVVLQQLNNRVIHVYGVNRITVIEGEEPSRENDIAKRLERVDAAVIVQLGKALETNSKLANKLREAENTITRMESELDTINNQHRIMAKQLAKAGERLKTSTMSASALKSVSCHYTQEQLDAIYEASKLDYTTPLVGSEVRALIGDIRTLRDRLDELDRDA